MRESKAITIAILSLFIISLILPTSGNLQPIALDRESHGSWPSENLPTNATLLDEIEAGSFIRVNDPDQAFDGWLLYSLSLHPNVSTTNIEIGSLLVTDNDGRIINGFFLDGRAAGPQLINSTTVMYGYDDVMHFWNYRTNTTESFPVPAGHHDEEYNPLTDTFIVLENAWFQNFTFEEEEMPVVGDDVVEYDREGNEIWRWEGNLTFPFEWEEFKLRNESRRGELDWMHCNSLYWDIDNDDIYVSVRHLDCVVKIDHATGETEWAVGRYSGVEPPFTLYNKGGEEVDSIFYHTHALEMIGPNRFIVYDNDFWNLTRPDPLIGITRLVEFVVNETAQTANEVWSYAFPAPYYANSQGDANRLPNGNTIAAHNLRPYPILSEVNQAGEIVWETTFNVTENDVGFRLQANGVQRILYEPIIQLAEDVRVVPAGANAIVRLNVWDTYQRRRTAGATFQVLSVDTTVLADGEFEFLPHWQTTELVVEVSGLAAGVHNVLVEITNEDGISAELVVTIEVASNLPLILGLG
ncbi:MAG: hypothetical protein EAX95_04905, partial [Candidatus Thorarchaeota archaeon]|nr:hypothetical protein [Candidatus Thorarchaeota archaeon]